MRHRQGDRGPAQRRVRPDPRPDALRAAADRKAGPDVHHRRTAAPKAAGRDQIDNPDPTPDDVLLTPEPLAGPDDRHPMTADVESSGRQDYPWVGGLADNPLEWSWECPHFHATRSGALTCATQRLERHQVEQDGPVDGQPSQGQTS